MEEKIAQLKQEAAELIKNKAQTLPELNDIRVRFLGKKGELTQIMKMMKDIPNTQKEMIPLPGDMLILFSMNKRSNFRKEKKY